jgi:thiol:disulfide interchange protein DsbD
MSSCAVVGNRRRPINNRPQLNKLPHTVLVLLALAGALTAQRLDPIQWTLTTDAAKAPPGAKVITHLTATAQPGWHLYSLSTPPGGPIPTTLAIASNPSVTGFQIWQPKPERRFDPNFGLDVETFENQAVFIIPVELSKDAASGPLEITAQVRYQACDDKQCLPPRKKTASVSLTVDPSAPSPPGATFGPDYTLFQPSKAAAAATVKPPTPSAPAAQDTGLARFLLVAFGFGLAALFTPCVFPMIPITVSFFIGQKNETQKDGLLQAIVFCLGIIVLFCTLGLAVKAILGPFGVVQLGSNPWVNGFIALIFFVFGLSLLGAFEITLPSGLLTKMDSASRRGGYLGTLLMGLTFSLTSFACVGPFVGTLLAASVQTGGLQPVFGMLSFATGLALPFFFLALFPSYLQRLPRSGGWMARVKIVLGFVILAAMLKYLSNVDQVLQTHILTRELYLAAWFVLFTLVGLYLLGYLRMEGIKPDEHVGVGRLLVAVAFLTFAVSLLPGMFGATLGALEAYVPPEAPGSGLAFSGTRGEQQVWLKDKYDEALVTAKRENKLVLVTFTGYACTNCHWMKANMFPRPEIASLVKDMVLVELYTDGTDDASRRNQKMQDRLFQTVAIPYYAIFDGNGNVVASFPGLTKDAKEFASFLSKRPTIQT